MSLCLLQRALRCDTSRKVQAQALYSRTRGLVYRISVLLLSQNTISKYVSGWVVTRCQEGYLVLCAPWKASEKENFSFRVSELFDSFGDCSSPSYVLPGLSTLSEATRRPLSSMHSANNHILMPSQASWLPLSRQIAKIFPNRTEGFRKLQHDDWGGHPQSAINE